MASDEGPVVKSARLRRELVSLRREARVTQAQVAEMLDWSPIKLLRIEGGHNSIKTVDLDALLTRYGVTSEATRERLQAINRETRERGWWWRYEDVCSAAQRDYIGYEAGATCVRQSPGAAIPELLQTREYAKAHIAGLADAQLRPLGRYSDASTRADEVADLRLQRQSELAQRSAPPRQYYVLDEGVIRRHVGVERDPMIMPDQLRYIADKAEGDELITVQVIPFLAGAHPGLSGSFTLLEFDGDLPDRVYLGVGPEMIARTDDYGAIVADYAEAFEALLKVALSADESIDFIRRAAEDMS